MLSPNPRRKLYRPQTLQDLLLQGPRQMEVFRHGLPYWELSVAYLSALGGLIVSTSVDHRDVDK